MKIRTKEPKNLDCTHVPIVLDNFLRRHLHSHINNSLQKAKQPKLSWSRYVEAVAYVGYTILNKLKLPEAIRRIVIEAENPDYKPARRVVLNAYFRPSWYERLREYKKSMEPLTQPKLSWARFVRGILSVGYQELAPLYAKEAAKRILQALYQIDKRSVATLHSS